MTRPVAKAFAYTRGCELLVFSCVGAPEAGIQVPAGTIAAGEAAEDAVLREAVEETGWTRFRRPRSLGSALFDVRPFGKDELHERRFFHLELLRSASVQPCSPRSSARRARSERSGSCSRRGYARPQRWRSIARRASRGSNRSASTSRRRRPAFACQAALVMR